MLVICQKTKQYNLADYVQYHYINCEHLVLCYDAELDSQQTPT